MTSAPTVRCVTPVPGPAASVPPQATAAQPLVAPSGPPIDVALRPLDGDVMDEVAFRRFIARHSAATTLSAQRTEFSMRSMRLYVWWWFWLTIIGAVIGGILLGTSIAEADELHRY